MDGYVIGMGYKECIQNADCEISRKSSSFKAGNGRESNVKIDLTENEIDVFNWLKILSTVTFVTVCLLSIYHLYEESKLEMCRFFFLIVRVWPTCTFPLSCKLPESFNRLFFSLTAQSKYPSIFFKVSQ